MLTARDIANKRASLIGWLRLFSLGAACIGLLAFLSWMLEGIIDGDLFDIGYYASRAAIALLGFSAPVVVTVLSRSIGRWLVPTNHARNCPQCDHPYTDSSEVCTECGLRIR